MTFKHIEALIDGVGELTIGRIGPYHCAAIATDLDEQLTALLRRKDETFEEFLTRIDTAIGRARTHEEFIDELA